MSSQMHVLSARRARRAVVTATCALAGALALPGLAHAANRDITVHLTNNSDHALDLRQKQLPGGCWGPGSPPDVVEIGATVDIHSESCDLLPSGTEFSVDYGLRDTPVQFRLHYDNP